MTLKLKYVYSIGVKEALWKSNIIYGFVKRKLACKHS